MFEKNDDKIYYENEMKILNQFNPENDELNQNYSVRYTYIDQNTETVGIRKKTLIKKKTKKKLFIPKTNNNNNMDIEFIVNENNKELVNNIFNYSFMYFIFTVC